MSDYLDYRGKCKEFSEEAVRLDPSLRLVRGHYFCPIWNSNEPHWWCVRPDGTIHDPTVKQFPSAGLGVYTEFNGLINCDQCGKEVKEEEASFESRYAFCCYRCHGKFLGVL